MTVRLAFVLEVEGKAEDAVYVADQLLDAGEPQTLVCDHECDAGPLAVVNAYSLLLDDAIAQARRDAFEQARGACQALAREENDKGNFGPCAVALRCDMAIRKLTEGS